MKTQFRSVVLSLSVLSLLPGASAVRAQESAATAQVEALKRQLLQLQESFERSQREHRQQMEALQKQVDALQKAAGDPRPAASPPPAPIATSAPMDAAVPLEKKPWSPSDPIALLKRGASYINVSFGALANFGWSTDPNPSQRLNLGDHDPLQRGFSMRNAEIVFEGAVDPYFKGQSAISFKLDEDMGSDLELEEVFLQTTSLPANLQLKAGHFFANFGRHNPLHPHSWLFVDQPLILNRALGPDGLRNVGTQLSWLAPTPFFAELSLGVFNGRGETAWSFRNPGEDDGTGVHRLHGHATMTRNLSGLSDFVFAPRLALSFDLTESQTLLLGTSGAFGPNNTGPQSRSELYGADIYWKWKSESAEKGFPFVAFQAEGLWRRFGAGEDLAAPVPLPAENLHDYGFYSQLLYGFKPRWVAGLRGEYVNGDAGLSDPFDVFRGRRTRLSPNLTWYPSEFSKLRLQYNLDRGQYFRPEHSIWLQFEFQLGAHAPHKF